MFRLPAFGGMGREEETTRDRCLDTNLRRQPSLILSPLHKNPITNRHACLQGSFSLDVQFIQSPNMAKKGKGKEGQPATLAAGTSAERLEEIKVCSSMNVTGRRTLLRPKDLLRSRHGY